MAETFAGWSILEVMGHRRLAGYVSEQQLAGAPFIRIDVPTGDGAVTQFYSPSAVYCITPTTEEIARALARQSQPQPVHAWELRLLGAGRREGEDAGDGEDDIPFESAVVEVRRCRVCGCTDDRACPGSCYWVEEDLCSACVGPNVEAQA